jgi:hypothetical protein
LIVPGTPFDDELDVARVCVVRVVALRLAGARFFAGARPLDERVALLLFRAAVDRLLERFAALFCFVVAMSPTSRSKPSRVCLTHTLRTSRECQSSCIG